MTKLKLLYAQKAEKFSEVCAVAGRELGYGELATLSVEDRVRVEDEAKQYVEQWGRDDGDEDQLHHSANYAFASSSGRVS